MKYSIYKKDPLGIHPYIRTVNDFPIKGIKFRDITSLIENPKVFVKTSWANLQTKFILYTVYKYMEYTNRCQR